MKKSIFTVGALLLVWMAGAQLVLKTIVTQGPVIAGEPFQVQYVLEDADQDADFFQPDFKQFHLVSGPHIYGGVSYGTDGPRRLKNIAFTLIALNEGRYSIPGASVKLHGRLFKSEPAALDVISPATAVKRGMLAEKKSYAADSYLSPGEDPYEKIRQNLFMKVSVDRKSCVVGQPITATFKLYSRLSSNSEIVKNPGFYGFAIQDMVCLADNMSATETVNGKQFKVHTIRKVQLYPLQAGLFTIDPMEVRSRVEFSTSAVQSRTEQQITEGVMPSEDELFSKPGFKVCEASMHTEAVAINVNALPANNRPDDFNGATGRFTVSASAIKEELGLNEEGDLVLTIEGKGNFTQIVPPAVAWPKAVEGFEPAVRDSFNKNTSPLEGKRVFSFHFVSAHPGTYTIPAISFSFFDPDSNRYKTASTKPVTFKVTEVAGKKTALVTEKKKEIKRKGLLLWVGLIAVLLCLGIFILRRKRNRPAESVLPAEVMPVNKPSVTALLHPASILLEAEDNSFYGSLRSAIWQFSSGKFGLSGSSMNKQSLSQALKQQEVDAADQQRLLRILDACEEGLFTGTAAAGDRKELLEETKAVLLRIS